MNLSYEDVALYSQYAESVIAFLTSPDQNIAVLCEKVGNYYQTTGNLDKALEFYQQYNQMEHELYEAYPENVGFKNDLAISYINLGSVSEKNDNKEGALMYYNLSKDHFTELATKFPSYKMFKENLQWVENKLTELKS